MCPYEHKSEHGFSQITNSTALFVSQHGSREREPGVIATVAANVLQQTMPVCLSGATKGPDPANDHLAAVASGIAIVRR